MIPVASNGLEAEKRLDPVTQIQEGLSTSDIVNINMKLEVQKVSITNLIFIHVIPVMNWLKVQIIVEDGDSLRI